MDRVASSYLTYTNHWQFWYFFFKKQIDILKDTIIFLEKQIKDLKNFTPDVVAKRLFDRSKLLEDEFESLALDNEKDKLRKIELEKELIETRKEAQFMRVQLENVQEILEDIDLPRDGKIKSQIAYDILRTADSHQCIFIPIWLWGNHDEIDILSLNERRPYKYQVIYPGMFKMYVHFYDNENKDIGYVNSPYLRIYNKDYFVTLLEIIKYLPRELRGNVSGQEGDEAYILPSAGFHCISPIYPNIIYLKIDVSKNQLGVIQEKLELQ